MSSWLQTFKQSRTSVELHLIIIFFHLSNYYLLLFITINTLSNRILVFLFHAIEVEFIYYHRQVTSLSIMHYHTELMWAVLVLNCVWNFRNWTALRIWKLLILVIIVEGRLRPMINSGEWVRGLFFAKNLICSWLLSDASVRDINKHWLWFTVSISSYLPRTDVWQQLWRRTGNSDGRWLSLEAFLVVFLF